MKSRRDRILQEDITCYDVLKEKETEEAQYLSNLIVGNIDYFNVSPDEFPHINKYDPYAPIILEEHEEKN